MSDFIPGFNVAQSVLSGQQLSEQQRVRDRNREIEMLQQGISESKGFNIGESEELARLAGLNPALAAQTISAFSALDESRQKDFFKDAQKGLSLLDSGKTEQLMELVKERHDKIKRFGGDTTDTDLIGGLVMQGRTGEARGLLAEAVNAGISSGFLPKPGEREKPQDLSVGATVYGRDENGNPRVGNVVFDKSNKKSWVEWADGGTTSIDKPSDAQKSAIRIAEAEKKAEIEGRAASEKLLTEERNKIRLDIYKTGREAKKGVNDLDRMQRAIDAFGTGKIEQFKLLAGPYIPGIDPTDPQAMQALLNKGVFPVLAGFSGAISEGERSFAEKTVANLGNTPEANKIIISHMKRALQDEIDKLDQFKNWEKEGNKEHESFQFTPVDFSERTEADILKEYGL